MERYNIISEKNKREIVLLRGSGCVYKKCTFCDYYTDSCKNPQENYLLNQSVLEQVTGQYGNLEVINSGSVFELDEKTLDLIKSICHEKKISTIHFESHYLYRKKIPDLRKYFSEFDLKMKLGLEAFDYDYPRIRRLFSKKDISATDLKMILPLTESLLSCAEDGLKSRGFGEEVYLAPLREKLDLSLIHI